MARTSEKSERRQELAIVGLLTCPTVELAAKHAGLSLSTLNRLLLTPDFQRAFRQAKQAALQQTIARLSALSGQAVDTLLAVMADPEAPASARVSAARAMLDSAVKASEVEDLAQRVTELEALIADQSKGRAV